MSGGMVMGQNTETLPGGCTKIAATKEITVRAGHKYAEKFPGRMYAFDQQEYHFEPCTKLTINFINEDNVRHQWMMHGLPRYLYPKGMFHLEVTGPGKISGTLILPPGDKTYLVHCDIAQHMEKGMKGQLKVGAGSGDLPSIPGVTSYVIQDVYDTTLAVSEPTPVADSTVAGQPKPTQSSTFISGMTVIGLAIGLLLAPLLGRYYRGMTVSEAISFSLEKLGSLLSFIISIIKKAFAMLMANKNKSLPEK
ncbi:MAG: copper oxidase [Methylococcales bacterium]|nr:copper oxidase [Methylococcales bacterium]